MEIDLILTVAKHGVIEPAEASHLPFIVKELKSDGIWKLALEAHYLGVHSSVVLSFFLTTRLMLARYYNALTLNFSDISAVWLENLK